MYILYISTVKKYCKNKRLSITFVFKYVSIHMYTHLHLLRQDEVGVGKHP